MLLDPSLHRHSCPKKVMQPLGQNSNHDVLVYHRRHHRRHWMFFFLCGSSQGKSRPWIPWVPLARQDHLASCSISELTASVSGPWDIRAVGRWLDDGMSLDPSMVIWKMGCTLSICGIHEWDELYRFFFSGDFLQKTRPMLKMIVTGVSETRGYLLGIPQGMEPQCRKWQNHPLDFRPRCDAVGWWESTGEHTWLVHCICCIRFFSAIMKTQQNSLLVGGLVAIF